MPTPNKRPSKGAQQSVARRFPTFKADNGPQESLAASEVLDTPLLIKSISKPRAGKNGLFHFVEFATLDESDKLGPSQWFRVGSTSPVTEQVKTSLHDLGSAFWAKLIQQESATGNTYYTLVDPNEAEPEYDESGNPLSNEDSAF